MKKILYYHIYLTDDYATWAYPFMEQFKLMEDFGLLSAFDEVNVTCIGQNDQRLGIFDKLCNSFRPTNIIFYKNSHDNDNSMLQNINGQKTLTENLTMCKIWNDSQAEDFQMLYLHSKGITSVDNHLKAGNIDVFKNYLYWRQFLNWGVIERWPECIRLLDKSDMVGVNYLNTPEPHYSGNFWWANSSHIRKLPDPSTTDWWHKLKQETKDNWLRTAPDRFRDEMWPCNVNGAKIMTLKKLDEGTNLSVKLIKRNQYA